METCKQLEEIIRKRGFAIKRVKETDKFCLIDFIDPEIEKRYKEDAKIIPAYYYSGVYVDKEKKRLETTVRKYIEGYKELYLDYCCENGEIRCRPHVNMEEKILSVEAKFYEDIIDKFKKLIIEMS